jgi:hypothetical protein
MGRERYDIEMQMEGRDWSELRHEFAVDCGEIL